MRKLQVGDKVNMYDGSYCFGIQHGRFTTWCSHANGEREGLLVADTDLEVLGEADDLTASKIGGEFNEVCDILVTNNNGGYWFTQSRLVRLCELEHTVSFDGGDVVTISDQSYQALRKALVKRL